MPYAVIIVWLTVVAVPVAFAETLVPPANGAPSELGSDTRAWLDLQRNGQAAAPQRPVSGVVASRTYKRYLDSFNHPIPMFFERESGNAPAQ
ncbi:MAG: DUF3613 domain-containing protein [Gammaproteobacteria bacterium]|nr:DUF3613 domain-containing protein [Gammaproteobacteria bacterium]